MGLNCAEPSSYMVDLSSAPRVPAETNALIASDSSLNTPPAQFDRFKYPVRYYFANFTDATRVHHEPKSTGSSPSSGREPQTSRPECPYRQDVQNTGEMFNRLLEDVSTVVSITCYLIASVSPHSGVITY